MSAPDASHYATLGLGRSCTRDEIRVAYRLLAKRLHPDVNHDSVEAQSVTQRLNAAYEVLSDPARRAAYDQELSHVSRATATGPAARLERNIRHEVRLRIEDFIKGCSVDVQVKDPGNPDGAEVYQLQVPPETAPGARFRLPRSGAMAGGYVQLRLKVLPGYRFQVRGSDIRCELRIDAQRAMQGGSETMERPTGGFLRVQIPAGVKRGEIVRVPHEGMPKPRGGRGDLLVRITYRPEVRTSRSR